MRISRTGISRAYLIGMVVLLMSASLFAASSIYEFTLPSIDGKPLPLANFKGKVVLVVNVASRCGFTPQYSALESTYEKFKDQGFVILGFPANNFGSQEPGTNQEIKTFCQTKYSVTFPMYAKVSVKGDDQTPLYKYLTTQANPARRRRHQMEFHEVSGGPQRQRGQALRARRHPRLARSNRRDSAGAEAVTNGIDAALLEWDGGASAPQ